MIIVRELGSHEVNTQTEDLDPERQAQEVDPADGEQGTTVEGGVDPGPSLFDMLLLLMEPDPNPPSLSVVVFGIIRFTSDKADGVLDLVLSLESLMLLWMFLEHVRGFEPGGLSFFPTDET